MLVMSDEEQGEQRDDGSRLMERSRSRPAVDICSLLFGASLAKDSEQFSVQRVLENSFFCSPKSFLFAENSFV
jgi:hypothetical protein